MHRSIGLTVLITVNFELTEIKCSFYSKNAMIQVISRIDSGHDSGAADLRNDLFSFGRFNGQAWRTQNLTFQKSIPGQNSQNKIMLNFP
jgi:hypothetical protein